MGSGHDLQNRTGTVGADVGMLRASGRIRGGVGGRVASEDEEGWRNVPALSSPAIQRGVAGSVVTVRPELRVAMRIPSSCRPRTAPPRRALGDTGELAKVEEQGERSKILRVERGLKQNNMLIEINQGLDASADGTRAPVGSPSGRASEVTIDIAGNHDNHVGGGGDDDKIDASSSRG